MSDKKERTVCIITDNGDGIKELVEKNGYRIAVLAKHKNWIKHIWEIEQCHLVILDEVDQFISGSLQLTDEEERILLGEGGPLVLVLVRDTDFRLDKRATGHRRWMVHHKSQRLDVLLQELFYAKPIDKYQGAIYEYVL